MNTRKMCKVVALILVIFVITFASNVACGQDFEEKTIVELEYCTLAVLDSNEYYGSRPLMIFFPGSGECNSINSAVRWLESYHIYDDIDCDIIVVTKKSAGCQYQDWEPVAAEVVEYLEPYYIGLSDDDIFPIIVDSVSFDGYGGVYFSESAMECGIFVDELNLADAVSYPLTVERIEELTLCGTFVNAFACNGGSDISARTRKVIDELIGSRNFYGTTIYTSHGAVLSKAVEEEGLHSEYIE